MSEMNPNARLQIFSDGVFAIAITLLILEIQVPPLEMMQSEGDVWRAIGHLWPSFLALLLSFIIIFISWYGHHALMDATEGTSSKFQFANGFFLLTVVIIPFPTAFMAEYLNSPFAQPAIVFYCLATLLHNIGWQILLQSVVKPKGQSEYSPLVSLVKKTIKGHQYGIFINMGIAILSWWFPYIALASSILFWSYWLYHALLSKQAL